jgi:glycosyltransferase involved in cell wall biosynthesis
LFNDQVHIENNRRYSSFIDITVVPSETLATILRRQHGETPGRIRVIPHGIHLEKRPAPCQSGQLDLPDAFRGKTLIGFFGRLSEEKRPRMFVEIANRLRGRRDLAFCMTGDGPERARVLSLIDKMGLKERFHAPGFVEDLAPLLEATDIVVVPSRLDGMPLIVLESQAAGKPVVASAVGSIPEMLADGEAGYICPTGDLDAFCCRIQQLADDPQLRRRMGTTGMTAVRQRYSAESMIQAYLDVFRAGYPTQIDGVDNSGDSAV